VGVNCSFFVHLTSLCLIAQKLSAKRTLQVLRHWICCSMLSRLNSEHIFACANLLNISNSLALIELIVYFMSEWISSNAYTGHNCFFISIVAHSQSVLLRMRKLWS